MFLANSLKEKLKRDYIEGETDSDGPLFRYEPPPKNPKVLLSFKEDIKLNQERENPLLWNIKSHQLQSFDKKDGIRAEVKQPRRCFQTGFLRLQKGGADNFPL